MDALLMDKNTLALLTEGVVMVDDRARPLLATRTSQPWLRLCIEHAPEVAAMIAAAKAGKLPLPASVDLWPNGQDSGEPHGQAWLVGDAKHGHALLIRPGCAIPTGKDPADSVDASGENWFMTLLGMDVRQEASHLAATLRTRTGRTNCPEPILHHASNLDALLEEISDLADLHERDELYFEERISVPALLHEVVDELQSPTTGEYIHNDLEFGDGPSPGPVYGNAHWLKKALHTLFDGVVQHRAQLSGVRIQLHQLGNFIVIGASAGTSRSVTNSGDEPGTTPSLRALRMRICHRVVKLHGGRLNVNLLDKNDAGGTIESFTLTLPTGLPERDRKHLSCETCPVNIQAIQYARDLSTLITRASPPDTLPERGTP